MGWKGPIWIRVTQLRSALPILNFFAETARDEFSFYRRFEESRRADGSVTARLYSCRCRRRLLQGYVFSGACRLPSRRFGEGVVGPRISVRPFNRRKEIANRPKSIPAWRRCTYGRTSHTLAAGRATAGVRGCWNTGRSCGFLASRSVIRYRQPRRR